MLRLFFYKLMTDIYVIWFKTYELYKTKVNDIFYLKILFIIDIVLNY